MGCRALRYDAPVPAVHRAFANALAWSSVDVTITGAADDEYTRPCRRWRAAALDRLTDHPHDVIIISDAGRYPLNDDGERVRGVAATALANGALFASLTDDGCPGDALATDDGEVQA